MKTLNPITTIRSDWKTFFGTHMMTAIVDGDTYVAHVVPEFLNKRQYYVVIRKNGQILGRKGGADVDALKGWAESMIPDDE